MTLAYNYSDFAFIYTDGSKSKMENITNVGSAVHIPDVELTLKWKLNANHSVIASELFAILQALRWIIRHAQARSKYVICSDSLSGLQLVSQIKPATYKDLIYKIHYCLEQIRTSNITIRLQWTPAHCGIAGNEEADDAAK